MRNLGLRSLDMRAEDFDNCHRLPEMQVIVGWDTLYSRDLGYSSRTREGHRNAARRYEGRVRRSEEMESDGLLSGGQSMGSGVVARADRGDLYKRLRSL